VVGKLEGLMDGNMVDVEGLDVGKKLGFAVGIGEKDGVEVVSLEGEIVSNDEGLVDVSLVGSVEGKRD
jgi:hypothetical protein